MKDKGYFAAFVIVLAIASLSEWKHTKQVKQLREETKACIEMIRFSNSVSQTVLLALNKVYPVARGRMLDSSQVGFFDRSIPYFDRITKEIDSVTTASVTEIK